MGKTGKAEVNFFKKYPLLEKALDSRRGMKWYPDEDRNQFGILGVVFKGATDDGIVPSSANLKPLHQMEKPGDGFRRGVSENFSCRLFSELSQ